MIECEGRGWKREKRKGKDNELEEKRSVWNFLNILIGFKLTFTFFNFINLR